MCIIIYKPKNQRLTKEELNEAWDTNPDGGGFAYIKHGLVYFKRGIMDKAQYIKEALSHNNEELLLHMRISTCNGVTPQGTHPFKLGNLKSMRGKTRKPLICMNGVIHGQPLHTKKGSRLNDTASYILDHEETFKVANQHILNLIETETGSKWAIATPKGITVSKGFIKEGGIYYSNLNHKTFINLLNDYYMDTSTTKHYNYKCDPKDYIAPQIYQTAPKDILWDLEDYVYINCNNFNCSNCKGCIYKLETVKEAKQFIEDNQNNIDYESLYNGGY